eukprot:TRINITY_DN28671_c0_g2_i1.p1 TRINITY_DN28671_c0_g2~~TRINITY_DN28671_c0_g2_i1.p1  ORF type:complete len:164 (-),score=40.12 TRINITY_DN28671_c0_g2_i1:160-618(-)
MKVPKPVVRQGELVTLHLHGVGSQGAKGGHAQHIELLAPGKLDTMHGYSVKLAGKHRELLHILKLKGHGDHAGHGHLRQVEPDLHLQVLEAVPLDYQLVDVGQLYIVNYPLPVAAPLASYSLGWITTVWVFLMVMFWMFFMWLTSLLYSSTW